MKRLIPAFVIFILVISFCISANLCVDKTSLKTLKKIEYCYQELKAGNTETALGLSENIKDSWHKDKETLEIFVNHSFLDKANLYICQLPVSIKNNSKNDFLVQYENIKTIFEQMSKEQKFGLHSFY